MRKEPAQCPTIGHSRERREKVNTQEISLTPRESVKLGIEQRDRSVCNVIDQHHLLS